MAISEQKMKIIIENYFKAECNVNTSIREAFEKGFRIGVKKASSVQPEFTKEYNLKTIYNIYVKIAQAHFVYQPSKPKAITAMPFDWIEVQNLLEKYLEDHGADFDALRMEYVSENVKDDRLSPV